MFGRKRKDGNKEQAVLSSADIMEESESGISGFILLAFAVSFGVLLFAEILSMFKTAMSLSIGVLKWPAVFGCVISLGLLFYVLFRGYLVFRKVPKVKQISETEFADRASEMVHYLKQSYLVGFFDLPSYLRRAGFRADHMKEVAELIGRLKPTHRLFHREKPVDPSDFLERFRRLQTLQDERASEIVDETASRVGVYSGLSQKGKLDVLIVLYLNTKMIYRLLVVYNRRTSRFHALKLCCRMAVNSLVAGNAQTTSEKVTQTVVSFFRPEAIGGVLTSVIPGVGKAVALVAEWWINKSLSQKLGETAKEAFRAVRYDLDRKKVTEGVAAIDLKELS